MKRQITASSMYDIINCHKEYIVGRLELIDGEYMKRDAKSPLEKYSDLKNALKTQNVEKKSDFRKQYGEFFAMGQSRLIPSYYDRYFTLLETNKTNHEVSLSEILMSLKPVSQTSKGRKSIQFSFATKLVHMINDDEPIYDSRIKMFYKKTEPPAAMEYKKRVATYIDIQKSIKDEYRHIIDDKLLEPSIECFRRMYANRRDHSDIKVIDWIIWQFVSLVNGGWIQTGNRGTR